MRSRRRFILLALSGAAAGAARRTSGALAPAPRIWLPIVQALPAADAPILGPASGPAEAAINWLAARCAADYSRDDVAAIVARYRELGDWAGMDWFLALAQLAHETGSLTSWWCRPPRCNPAGIGVTGRTQPGDPNTSPGPNWAWDEAAQLWREGVSFPSWPGHAIPAHLGRLLAYALTDAAANDAQRQLIDYALRIRPLLQSYRGSAPTIVGLNGRWAVPGTDYGQRIVDLARRMRG